MSISAKRKSANEQGGKRLIFPILACLFGLMTIIQGAKALGLWGNIAPQNSEIVPLVLQFNFLSGFLYVLAGLLIIKFQVIGLWLARVLAVAIFSVVIYLTWHIIMGGAFMPKTVAAMLMRLLFWVAFAYWAQRKMTTKPARPMDY